MTFGIMLVGCISYYNHHIIIHLSYLKVLFTDESKFNLHGSDGKVYVWRKPNTEFEPKNTIGTVKHGGGSVMVWGCMSSAGVGHLHFIDGILDKFGYLDILKKNVKQSAEKLGILEDFALYQDNDPKHTSMLARLWLIYNCPKLIQTPAQSPDINVIENLWEILARKVYQNRYNTVDQLKKGLLAAWNSIEPEICKKLVKSVPNRLQAVVANKGFATKY